MIRLSHIIRHGGKFVATSALLFASTSVADLCCNNNKRPRISPACHPTWGYHQTCWRRFPCLEPCVGWGDMCDVCPPQGTGVQPGRPVLQGPPRVIQPGLQVHPGIKLGQPPVILQLPGAGAPINQIPPDATVIPQNQVPPHGDPRVILQPPGAGAPINQIPPGAIVIPQNQAPQPTRTTPVPAIQAPPHGDPPVLPVNPAPLNESALPAAPPLPQQSFRYQRNSIQQTVHGQSIAEGGRYIGHQMNIRPISRLRNYPTGTWQAPVAPAPEKPDNSFIGRLKRWFK